VTGPASLRPIGGSIRHHREPLVQWVGVFDNLA